MRRVFARTAAAVTVGVTLSAFAVSGVGAASAASRAPSAKPAAIGTAVGVPGARLWLGRYNGPGNGDDRAPQVAVSPDGSKAYVTGTSQGAHSGLDCATAAYNAVTGARLWVARYNGPVNGDDSGRSVAVSPNGQAVYVSGWSSASDGLDAVTIAYNAVTGGRLWAARYKGAYNTNTRFLVAASPTGTRVYVTGIIAGATSPADYITIAYNAATGSRLWATPYNGPGNSYDFAFGEAISPDGSRVYVTGTSFRAGMENSDYATVAYSASTGAQLWASRYNGPANIDDYGQAVAVSPGGGTVYVTGSSPKVHSASDYTTVAYGAVTGARLWARRYNGPANRYDSATTMAVSPAGTVIIAGNSQGATSGEDLATVAYSAAGTQLWAKRYNGPGNRNDGASSVAAGNGKAYVAGYSYGGSTTLRDYVTIAYNIVTGVRLWVSRYDGPAKGNDEARSIASRGGRVTVTGFSAGTTTGLDYATIAYHG